MVDVNFVVVGKQLLGVFWQAIATVAKPACHHCGPDPQSTYISSKEIAAQGPK
jgi:hypothetical protein